jgi:hypothetical protein
VGRSSRRIYLNDSGVTRRSGSGVGDGGDAVVTMKRSRMKEWIE